MIDSFDGVKDAWLIEKVDVFLCLGGDGMILGVLRMMYFYNKLCFGVRIGNLGFLSVVELNGLKDFL